MEFAPSVNIGDSQEDNVIDTNKHKNKVGSITRYAMLVKVSNDVQLGRYIVPDNAVSIDNIRSRYLKDHNRASKELGEAIKTEDDFEDLIDRREQIAAGNMVLSAEDKEWEDYTDDAVAKLLLDARKKRQLAQKARDEAYKIYQDECENPRKTKSSGKRLGVWKDDNNVCRMYWSYAPAYLKDYMPEKQDPQKIYREITHRLKLETQRLNHEDMMRLWREFKSALPDKYTDYKAAVQEVLDEADRMARTAKYNRLHCAVMFSALISEMDQRKVITTNVNHV